MFIVDVVGWALRNNRKNISLIKKTVWLKKWHFKLIQLSRQRLLLILENILAAGFLNSNHHHDDLGHDRSKDIKIPPWVTILTHTYIVTIYNNI